METVSLVTGIAAGMAGAYVIFYLLNKSKNVPRKDFDVLSTKYNEGVTASKLFEERVNTLTALNRELTDKLNSREKTLFQLQNSATALDTQLKNSEDKVAELMQELTKERGINTTQVNEINIRNQRIAELMANSKAVSESLSAKSEISNQQAKQIEALNTQLISLKTEVSEFTARNRYLNEKLTNQKTEVEELQKMAHLQFETIANRLLEEKSSKFSETNKTNIESLLNPLKEDINKFKTKVEETYDKESKQRFSLEEKVKELIEQTDKVSAEANNLATALKGKPQKRGNWGEMILERILESSGLTKDREYSIQQSLVDEEGSHKRPDVIVRLPDERTIIIDSKVSLIAYDKYVATEDTDEQKIYLDEHLNSMYLHIDRLSSKRYDYLGATLDFTMMFVPIEPAYLIAMQGDSNLWTNAYSKRILLISPTNLIACLKLISDLWRREWQNKNAKQIVEAGEKLYEKFIGFSQTFEEIGKSLKSSQDKYDKALGLLKDGRGNLVNQAVRLKKLGLKSEKKVSANLLPLEDDDSESDSENEIDL
jgi:DNA recombination protein RmuC